MTPRRGPIVTIDGPAGSGKSTTAKEVARRLGFRHLDSGALYRAMTLALQRRGVPPEAWPHLSEEELAALDVRVRAEPDRFVVLLDGEPVDAELRTPEVTSGVSHLARLPNVRRSLLALQRDAGAHGRLVADGRDMGTVVFPDADVKVFLTADVTERARGSCGGDPSDVEAVAREAAAIAERDARDAGREISPLRRPEDAVEIDTTDLTFDEQVERVVALVREALAGR